MKALLQSRARVAIALALGAMLLLSIAGPAAAADPARPFRGTAAGPSTIGAPIAACPAGTMFFVEANGTGNFTHLGRVTYTLQQCAAVNFATGEGWTTKKGLMTITAANGDRLMLSYDMTFVATPVPVPTTAVGSMDWIVSGGTGRFAAATGSGDASVKVRYTPDLTGADFFSIWWGKIAY